MLFLNEISPLAVPYHSSAKPVFIKFSRNVTIYLEDIWQKHILYVNQGP